MKDQYKKSKSQMTHFSSELHTVEVYKGKVEAMADSDMKTAVLKGLEVMAKDLLARKAALLAEQLKFPKQVDDPAEAEAKSKEIKAWNDKVQEELKKFRKEFAKHKKFVGGMKHCCLKSSGLQKAIGLAEALVSIDSFGTSSLANPMWKTLCLQLLLCCLT